MVPTEFLTFSFWNSLESIVTFAGEDISQAVSYAGDDRFLVDRETTVTHFDMHSNRSDDTVNVVYLASTGDSS
jgi:uncharacterized protein YfbU (UPF0304 family)